MLLACQLRSMVFTMLRKCGALDEAGATAVEYSLIAALIGVSLYLGLSVYYEALTRVFGVVITSMRNALG